MKAVFASITSAGALCLAGCANEGPTAEELEEKFRRGATGHGQLTPDIDRSDDPYVKPREGRPIGDR